MERIETKTGLLERLRQERARWDALLAEVTPARMEIPDSLGEWTFKDTVVHLTTWWRFHIARLADARDGERPYAHPPQSDVPVINEWTYRTNRARPLADVLHDAAAAWQAFEQGLQSFDEEALMAPGHFPWLDGQALGPSELHDFVNHLHEEHEPAIRDLIRRGDKV